MKLTLVSGSQRAHSQSLNVANYLKSLAEAHFDQIEILDLHELDLPFWNEGVWQNREQWQPWRNVAQGLKQSDAFVFITPEWHGMATPALKNFLLLTTDDELAHKPALLVSVSASVNGVYPISELRMTGNKNNHVCFLPDHLIFRDCEQLITAEHQLTDPQMQARSEYTIALLSAYATALAPVHRDMVNLGKTFRYGM
ncbi:NADPH-dependent FMN reductase [Vibrio mimicus]|uniref:NADPH-dependent oxidoreductase n=1 Tax=Vibrio mimicus TaxID=674 RepID=A0A2J9VI99_VIBMI|nr:NAD(P)H-dependent oxidoreductase [Vibrio mimicus]EEW09846.1 putative reductase [Vibrio mimicus VM573]EGU19940.1 putative reductase [Vibrio mimicus SX-4]EMB51910.1 azoreductase [Vibrio mimicus CAIM 602]KFE31362.1 NADPH-dependent FMN reductase family protein [Vibrio mimicus]MBY7675626.1 NAD(P)H-dependent oxidoreductase [Vibrio mimicus]